MTTTTYRITSPAANTMARIRDMTWQAYQDADNAHKAALHQARVDYIPVAVQAGAALLDERHPGWRQHVPTTPDKFYMGNSHCCVAGWLYRNGVVGTWDKEYPLSPYERAIKLMGLYTRADGYSHGQPVRYGFTLDAEMHYNNDKLKELWQLLTDTWKQAILT